MASSEITLEAVPSVSDIPAAEWDACANPKPDPNSLENLDTLASGGAPSDSCTAQDQPITPSFPTHFSQPPKLPARPAPAPAGARGISLARLDGEIAGIVPCYLKSHSQGEYVFDRGWADAYERAGGRYYPKLQASVPFTPATGPRLLIRDGVDRERIGTALASGLMALCNATNASSVHVTFAREAEAKFLGEHGFLQRNDQQFHWHNDGYGTFDDFLDLAEFAPPQGDQARTARGDGRRHHHPQSDRSRHHRGSVGRLLRVLHGDRLAQMGPALSDPQILLADRREHEPRRAAGDGPAQQPLDRRRDQFHRLEIRCSAATGALSSIIRSCISRSAIIRPSTLRSGAG